MKKFLNNFIRSIVPAGIVLSVILSAAVLLPAKAQATNQEVTGYAWSSNIGWISFNCLSGGNCGTSNYKVYVDDATGRMSGYAWSSNVGWVGFNAADISDCAVGATQPQITLSSGKVDGWARVLIAKTTNDPYWNGCISLSGTRYESPDTSGNRGVTYNTSDKTIKGYAWGSNVLGWLSFNASCANCGGGNPPPPNGQYDGQYDFGITATDQVAMDRMKDSLVIVPVSVTRIGSNDIGISNLVVSGMPTNLTATWLYTNNALVSGNRKCATTLPGMCQFNLRLKAAAGIQAPNFPAYFTLKITGTGTSSPSITREKNISLEVDDSTVVSTTPNVLLTVNDKFTPTTANNKVVLGSKNNKVSWVKGGSGTFDKCIISSSPANSLWNGTEFDGSYSSFTQTGVTIGQKTTFSVNCKSASSGVDTTSAVTVDVVASPDFREF